jgi:acyl-CoA hydrolase
VELIRDRSKVLLSWRIAGVFGEGGDMEKVFEHYMLVRQEHLNQYGSLFGGRVLSVIDELAFIACTLTWPGNNFVTRSVEDAGFTVSARRGDVIRFDFGVEKVGRTSVQVRVIMNIIDGEGERESFNGRVVMVCVDSGGNPVPVSCR